METQLGRSELDSEPLVVTLFSGASVALRRGWSWELGGRSSCLFAPVSRSLAIPSVLTGFSTDLNLLVAGFAVVEGTPIPPLPLAVGRSAGGGRGGSFRGDGTFWVCSCAGVSLCDCGGNSVSFEVPVSLPASSFAGNSFLESGSFFCPPFPPPGVWFKISASRLNPMGVCGCEELVFLLGFSGGDSFSLAPSNDCRFLMTVALATISAVDPEEPCLCTRGGAVFWELSRGFSASLLGKRVGAGFGGFPSLVGEVSFGGFPSLVGEVSFGGFLSLVGEVSFGGFPSLVGEVIFAGFPSLVGEVGFGRFSSELLCFLSRMSCGI